MNKNDNKHSNINYMPTSLDFVSDEIDFSNYVPDSPLYFPNITTWDVETEKTIIPSEFIEAINKITKSKIRYASRQARCLFITKEDLTKLVVNKEDGFCVVDAPGGGMCQWNLCCYKSKLYFVFSNNYSEKKELSVRETCSIEIEELIKKT